MTGSTNTSMLSRLKGLNPDYRSQAQGAFKHVAGRSGADDPPGAVPVQLAPIPAEENRTVTALADGQVDRPGSTGCERIPRSNRRDQLPSRARLACSNTWGWGDRAPGTAVRTLGDLQRTRSQLRAVEADMVAVLGELSLSRLAGIPRVGRSSSPS